MRRRRKKSKAALLYTVVIIAFSLAFMVKTYILPVLPGEKSEFGKIGTVDIVEDEVVLSDDSRSDEDNLLTTIPEYSGTPVYVLNDNRPEFAEEEYGKAKSAYIRLSELDFLGRCGTCEASLGKEMLDNAGERRDISGIHPTGWNQASYPDIIDAEGGWLFHRSHLIAHMFAGADPEIDGEKNLITATEYCNEKGMLPYAERAVQNWLIKKAEGGRVLYRVTPVFKGTELVARGVHIEAGDVETMGTKFHINVFCYNVEPGIEISYLSGFSQKAD